MIASTSIARVGDSALLAPGGPEGAKALRDNEANGRAAMTATSLMRQSPCLKVGRFVLKGVGR